MPIRPSIRNYIQKIAQQEILNSGGSTGGSGSGIPSVPLKSDLPLTANDETIYFVQSDNKFYAFETETSSWVDTGVTRSELDNYFASKSHTHAEFDSIHNHANKTTLDKLSDNGTNLLFNGQAISGNSSNVEDSAINGNIKVNGVEINVYDDANKADVDHTHSELHSHANKSSLDRLDVNANGKITVDGVEQTSSSTGASINDGVRNNTETWSSTKIGNELDGKSPTSHTHSELHSHSNKNDLDRISISVNNKLAIDGVEQNAASGGSVVSDSATNGNIVIDGAEIIVYDDSGKADVNHTHPELASSHSHSNKASLDKISETNGKLTFDGVEVGGSGGLSQSEADALYSPITHNHDTSYEGKLSNRSVIDQIGEDLSTGKLTYKGTLVDSGDGTAATPSVVIDDNASSTDKTYSSSKIESLAGKVGNHFVNETRKSDGAVPVFRNGEIVYEVPAFSSGGNGLEQTNPFSIVQNQEVVINHNQLTNDELLMNIFEQQPANLGLVNTRINYTTESEYIQEDATLTDINGKAQLQASGTTNSSNSSVYFDGVDDRINFPHKAAHNITNNWTMEFWMKPFDLNQSQKYILSKGTAIALIWEYVDNSIEFFLTGATGTDPRSVSKITLSSNAWTHISYSYNGTTLRKYVNGVEVGNANVSFAFATTSTGFVLGCAGTSNYFKGYLDDFRVWNVVRSASEIQSNYQKKLTGSETGLVLYSPLEEGSGTVANDLSVNAAHGTLTGAVFSTTEKPPMLVSSYPTGVSPYVTTSDVTQIKLKTIAKINSVDITESNPAGTDIKSLVSFDGRTSWKAYNGSVWSTVDLANINTQGSTVAQIESGLLNYTPAESDLSLDFAFELSTTVASSTPSVDGISINYDEKPLYSYASLSSESGNGDYSFKRVNGTSSLIKKKTAGSATIKVNFFTGVKKRVSTHSLNAGANVLIANSFVDPTVQVQVEIAAGEYRTLKDSDNIDVSYTSGNVKVSNNGATSVNVKVVIQ